MITFHLLYSNLTSNSYDAFDHNLSIAVKEFTGALKDCNQIDEYIIGFYNTGNDLLRFIQDIKYPTDINDKHLLEEVFYATEQVGKLKLFCQMIDQFGQYDLVVRKIAFEKKRPFLDLQVGDTVYIKLKEDTPSIETRVINKKKGKIQVAYRRRWFSSNDYPQYIRTKQGQSCVGKDIIEEFEFGKYKYYDKIRYIKI